MSVMGIKRNEWKKYCAGVDFFIWDLFLNYKKANVLRDCFC
jgi:hypothetical protein